MEKKMTNFFILALLSIVLCAVSVYALPDNPPTCSLSPSTTDTTTTAVLTAVSVDTLSNAGIDTIQIFENGALISNKACGSATSCVSTKTVVHTASGNYNYYAVCKDKSSQQTTSNSVQIHFAGANNPPVIDSIFPTSNPTIQEDQTQTFRVNAHDSDGDSLSYEWKLDSTTVQTDNTGSTGQSSYIFSQRVDSTRSFSVSVTVRDNRGGVAVRAWTIKVNDARPTVDISGDSDLTECDTFTFNANINSFDTVNSIAWDFGDGATDSGSASVSHRYAEQGTYTVSVTVTDSNGDTATDTMTVTVQDISPVVDAGADQTIGEGTTAEFAGTASMPCDSDSIISQTWTFDDGSTASGPTASHTYNTQGTFTVTFTVCDEDSCTSDTLTVTVTDAVPDASFTFDPQNPNEGDVVQFTDTSTSYDPITGWSWDFGDGATSTEQNPTHTYTNNGTYTVTLTVTDSNGDADTATATITVGNVIPSSVLVTLNATSGTEPTDVHADCTATGGNLPYTFQMDFGDGTAPVSGNSNDHSYVQNGTYTVTCTVTDVDGDSASGTATVTIADTLPTADFTWTPTVPLKTDNVDFDATAAGYDQPLSYSWDFGDQGTSNVEDPVHAYANGGDYNITLIVTDSDGSTVTVRHTIHVSENPPVVDLTVDPTSGTEPLTVTADCTVITGGKAPLAYLIDFGDGTIFAGDHAMHIYAQNSTYTVTCTVTDANGDIGTDNITVVVTDTLPTVNFTYTPTDPLEGDVVSFDSTASAYDMPLNYSWDFGDGTSSTLADPQHTYANSGIYTVTVIVTDADGSTGQWSDDIFVDPNVPGNVSLVANTTSGNEPLTVEFSCTAISTQSPTYHIDFGDGGHADGQTATHTYLQQNTYTAVCTVTDSDGDTDTAQRTITVLDTVPAVDFTFSPANPVEGQTVTFTSTISAYDVPFTILWNFDDGTTSTDANTTHVFGPERAFNVTLTVTDADGSSTTVWHVVNVGHNPAIVNLVTNTTTGLEPLSVSYNCSAGNVISVVNNPFAFTITFGDGTSTTAPAGTHDYTAPGSYIMNCTATDSYSNTDNDEVVINVGNDVPTVDLIANPTSGLEGMTVDFNCSVSGGNAPLSYMLEFGDGSSVTTPTAQHTYVNDGVYNATCLVLDADGDSGSDFAVINVSNNIPVANLVVNVTGGFEPLSINYTCNVGGGNSPFTFVIDFGDNSGSTQSTGIHTYTEPGSYLMKCEVLDADGDMDQDFETILVINNPPEVDLKANPTSGLEGVTVDFNCSVTNGNLPFSYLLNFGDGTTSTSPVISHTYTLEGVYNATCTVTDADLDVGVDSQIINISNNPPVVNLDVNATSGLEPLSINYTCNVGGGNSPFAYSVDFGDGTSTVQPQGTHDYPNPGIFTLSCTVSDVDGDVDSDSEFITVINNGPVVDLAANPTTGPEGIKVDFNCSATNGNLPLTYLINFGDGTTSTNPVVSHTYPLEGLYNATCSVTDVDLDTGIDGQLINITNNPPVVNLVTNVTSGLEPLSLSYVCNVGNGNAPFGYAIDFGDGATSTAPAGTHDYPTPGTYVISCAVTDVDGDTDSDERVITVINNPPIVNLAANPASGLEGMTVDFNCSVTAGNAPFGFLLDFGDGTSTVNPIDSHTYNLEGSYNATCTVTDVDGDVGIDNEIISVANNPPVANLVTNVSTGTEPLSVLFNCTVGNGNAPFTYQINFGDGTSVVSQSAIHTYLQNSTYIPSCIVRDSDGDIATDNDVIVVFDSEPYANFTAVPSTLPEGDLVQFETFSTAYDGIVSWSWNFGDGNTSNVPNPIHIYSLEGIYFAVLTVTDSDGSATSHVERINVTNNVPIVNVTVAPIAGTEPLTATIDCSATRGNWPLTYLVMYGDGTSTTSQTSTHTYTKNGTYPVVCQVTDVDGDISNGVVMITVNDTTPTASFTFAPANPRAGDTVTFTDTSIGYDGITAWAWDFENDGIVDSVAQNPTHVFASANLYVVNLTVADADGSTAWTIRTVPVNISVGAPIIFGVSAVDITNVSANITWGTDQGTDSLVEYGLTTALGSTTYAAGTIFNHNLPLSGLVQNTTYYYNVTSCNMFAVCSEAGPYNFTTLPTSIPDVTPPGPVTGLNESGAGSNWINWAWTNPSDPDYNHVEIWVNGTNVANVSAPGSSYNATGLAANTTYEVTIVTVDNSGNRNTPGVTDSATTTPGADITPPGSVSGLNETGVGTTWINWAWTNPADLDYNHSEIWVNGTHVSDVAGPTSSYNATGLTQNTTYQIVVITVDNTGNRNTPGVSDSATTSSTVVSLPVAGISAVPASGIIPLQVQFNASVTGGVAPFTYLWTFGDGQNSTLQNPLHIYNVAGPYTVTLNVTDSNGNWDTETTTITANVVVHDIAVNSINYTKEGRTLYLYDPVQVNASVSNVGTVSETFTLQLEIDGTVVDTQTVTLASGVTTTASLNWANASIQGFHTALVRANVVGDTVLSNQFSQKTMRVWSVNDIVDTSTRYIVYWAGVAYVPILNAYINETYYDLKATMTSGTAIVAPPATQLVTLNPSETKILMWTVAALPGDVLTVTEGNNEFTFATTV